MKLQRRGIGNESSTSKILFQKDSSYKCQFCTEVRALSQLISEVWAKYKDVPTKILKRDARTNSSSQNLKAS